MLDKNAANHRTQSDIERVKNDESHRFTCHLIGNNAKKQAQYAQKRILIRLIQLKQTEQKTHENAAHKRKNFNKNRHFDMILKGSEIGCSTSRLGIRVRSKHIRCRRTCVNATRIKA